MASKLREVLDRFSTQSAPISVSQMARELHLTPETLADMIDYWVRRGKLREVTSSGANCTTCGIKGSCPFVVALPRYYELVNEQDAPAAPVAPVAPAACGCGSGCGCGA